jgi:non-heme chloroperoxidase
MLFFLHPGYRVIAHDRRGHGRSAQVSEGNDMNHYAHDLAELTQRRDLHDAIHVGYSAGGGEVARYIGRHGESRVAMVVLISAVNRMPTTHADVINADCWHSSSPDPRHFEEEL